MFKVTDLKGVEYYIEDTEIENIELSPAVGANTRVIYQNGKQLFVQEDPATIQASSQPLSLLLFTLANGSTILQPFNGIKNFEGIVGGKTQITLTSSRILIAEEDFATLATQLATAIAGQFVAAGLLNVSDPTQLDFTYNIGGGFSVDLSALKQDIIDSLVNGIIRKAAVISILDATAAPPVGPNDGDRYIVDESTPLNAAWGPLGVTNNDIIQWDAGAGQWLVESPAEGWTCLVDDLDKDAVFVDDGTPQWEIRTNINQVSVSNTVYVMAAPFGDDTLGLRERLDRPFASPWAAVDAAQAGDTIVVLPGTYSYSNAFSNRYLPKNGTKMYCYPGVTIRNTIAGRFPFWDQGVAIEWEMLGYADIELFNAEENETFMTQNSSYRIECNNLTKTGRWNSNAGARFDLLVRGVLDCRRQTLMVWRNSVSQPTVLNLDVNEWRATRDVFGFSYAAWDFRNFSESGQININIKKFVHHHSGIGGFFNHVTEYADKNIIIGEMLIDPAGQPALGNYLFGGVNFGGKINMQVFNMDTTMNMPRFTGAATVPLRGRIYLQGEMDKPNYGGNPPLFSGLLSNSNLEMELDLQVTDTNIGQYLFNLNGQPTKSSIKGKLYYGASDATNTPFNYDTGGGNIGLLHRLTVRSETTFLAQNAGAGVENVPCISVYANVGFDPLKHVGVIETPTIDPLVNV